MMRLRASRDPGSGEVYVPPRSLAADGSLREAEPCDVEGEGVLNSFTRFMGEDYGVVDLACGARVQCYLEQGEHAIGAHYIASAIEPHGRVDRVRFRRG